MAVCGQREQDADGKRPEHGPRDGFFDSPGSGFPDREQPAAGNRPLLDAVRLEHRGYTAGPIDFDPEDGTFSGVVAGLRDVIHFEGSTAQELLESFRGGIDAYLALSAERGEEPEWRQSAT